MPRAYTKKSPEQRLANAIEERQRVGKKLENVSTRQTTLTQHRKRLESRASRLDILISKLQTKVVVQPVSQEIPQP